MKIFLDVGAHIGQTLKVALEAKYGFDKIYCFEPISECCDALKTYQDQRIIICEYGLWNESCIKQIYDPKGMGASLFKDKFNREVASRDIKLVGASDWFAQNLQAKDQVYLKLNCEGSECAILNDLIKSQEYKKIAVLMVDFDVRKIPSQKHLMDEMKVKLQQLGIPKIFYIDQNPLQKITHSDFTHYWLNSSGSSFSNVGRIINTLGYLVKKYQLDLTTNSPIEIPNVSRNDLPQWLHELNFKIGVEVGVAAGEYSENICQANPQMKVYGVDSWTPYAGYTDYVRPHTFARLYQQATDRLTKYPNYVFINTSSLDALNRFANNSLDFVYIDANHQDPYITQDIVGWSKKVKSGGIVSGHDYASSVKNAVDKYALDHHIKPLFILRSDETPTWMWVKP